MLEIHVDVESRSAADLRKTGVAAYSCHPTTDLWSAYFELSDESNSHFWKLGEPLPRWITDHIASGGGMVAFNAAFEMAMWEGLMGPRYGWPIPKIEQWRCVMVQCMAMALPASLEMAAKALQSPIEKDEAGGRLMLQMAKPRANKDGKLTWWDTPEKLERLYAYNIRDVKAEIEVDHRSRPLSATERRVWWMDQDINRRGVQVDLPLCRAAITMVEKVRERLDLRMAQLTEYDVTGCTNRNQFAAWLRRQGIEAESVAKDALAEMLARDDLTPVVREAILVRREGAKAASSKVDALVNGTSPDGRARGLLQYHGTVTGRWSGRRFQPQNLVRSKTKDIDSLVRAIRSKDPELLEMFFGNPLSAIGDAVRSMITCAEGHRLVTADFANIEGRVAAWYAGEAWKIKAFREFDAGSGPDLYKVAYSRSFGVPVDAVKDDQRQIGKVMELSLQYQGGHGAFVAMAAGYGVEPDQITPIVRKAVDPAVFEKALKRYRPQNGFGMKPETWAALRVLIDGWRAAHPNIVQSWKDLEAAAMSAVEAPGHVFSVGSVKFRKKGSFLWMQLPSGRSICFPYPKIKEKLMPWTETKIVDGAETEVEVYKPSLCYMGVDSFTKQWSEQFAYGGQIFDYVVQGTARDIMAEAMFRLESAGYPIVLTVHDEIVSEPRAGHGSLNEFKALMAEVPSWAAGCPIACSGWEGARYRKG